MKNVGKYLLLIHLLQLEIIKHFLLQPSQTNKWIGNCAMQRTSWAKAKQWESKNVPQNYNYIETL